MADDELKIEKSGEGQAAELGKQERKAYKMGIIDRIRSFRRTDDFAKAEEEAYKEQARRERNAEEEPKQARGKGGSPIIPQIEIKPRSHFLSMLFIAIAVLIFSAWYWNFMGYILSILSLLIFIVFIGYGLGTGLTRNDTTKIFVSLALLIWFIDMFPMRWIPVIGPYLENFFGPLWGGFDLPLVDEIFQISWLAIFTSGVVFVLLYIDMVFDIIHRDYVSFLLGFFIIIISNNLLAKLPTEFGLKLSIPIPGGATVLALLFAILIGLVIFWVYKTDKISTITKFGRKIPAYFSRLFMFFVISFFFINDGWLGNKRAILHAIYIAIFGFFYMKPREKENPAVFYILLPLLLIFDFYGYGLLSSTGYLWAKFIPVLVIFVVAYCYAKEESAYALITFIFIVTLILILSLQAWSYEGGIGTLSFREKTDRPDITQFFDAIFKQSKSFVEGKLEFATGGYYRSQVEKNQYEPLGVYFERVRAAQPKFYTDEPVTIWATINSRTLEDPVTVKFDCYRREDGERKKRGAQDNIEPKQPFTVATFEETDVECTFNNMETGTNLVTLSATYNFETSAYQKAYFIDRERLRAMSRENLDPLKEFGITDREPAAIYTNGPVEIAVSMQSLIPISADTIVLPTLGILLQNRNQINDKDGKIIGEFQGKIKNITELVVVLPAGMTIDGEKCTPVRFKTYTKDDCISSCVNVCRRSCEGFAGNSKQQCLSRCTQASCTEQCDSFFKSDIEGIGDYIGYQIDIEKIRDDDDYKDIDRYRNFVCRLNAGTGVLENTPITTKFIRIKARYDYSIDKSINVLVETAPIPEQKTFIFQSTVPQGVYFDEDNENEVKYSKTVYDISSLNNVNYLFVKAIIQHESQPLWNPDSLGDGGNSKGLMQISTSLAPTCKPDYATNPTSNIECGVKHIKSLMTESNKRGLSQDLENVAAAYNCGAQALDKDTQFGLRWKNPAYCNAPQAKTDTREYVNRIMENLNKLVEKLD